LKPGVEPGTVDIDLNVKDTLPLHGNVELNNRYIADTTRLRLNGSLSYDNLWQLGHGLGFSFQIAPENLDDAEVFSAYYLARFPNVPWLSLMLTGTKQNSDVSTLGGTATAGRGEIVGLRALLTLPELKGFYHSLSLGIDYKRFQERTRTFEILGSTFTITDTPITYYPLSAVYDATWVGKGRTTELDAGVYFHLRGLGSDPAEFDFKRYKATGSYIYFRGDLSHTQDLPGGAQLFAKVQGQASSQPLINSEQFSAGGLGSARGYLEAEALGDNALFGTVELRSPSLLGWWDKENKRNEWRFYGFVDAGYVTLNEPLPEQDSRFNLASYGFGSRVRLFDTLNGSVDAGLPLISQAETQVGDWMLTFRVWAEF
jgi:hemolysin activation/secretion protein